ncbi:heavy-metal-associated domain-containing protein [Spiractinospora alimapuensis]|uniref:heavy-metal-associated domain-containing protein n=1 Tax=Spiractinospora alimapuensis TaxID=2820884 RepID=UPI001F25262E|nr:heavy metal-associated domain-containing protein [Spiractinospora alimapuensis]QVQ51375.1 heavy-metal-associated domain-containing protein [Spiractinospora alimapuensis]
MSTTEFAVTGMSCGHCETAIRSEVSLIDGVRSIEVSAATGRLVITAAKPIEDADVIAAVDEAGYEAVRS